jgi:hypothetical protein
MARRNVGGKLQRTQERRAIERLRLAAQIVELLIEAIGQRRAHAMRRA